MATLGVLHDQNSTTNPWIVGQRNTEETELDLFYRTATRINATPVTTTGAPAVGTWQLSRLYRDVNGAQFLCTVAGTPGTWIQYAPAIVTAYPGSPPTDYWVLRTDLDFGQYYWDGATWVSIGGGAALGSALPLATGAATIGTSLFASHENHVHPLGDISVHYPPQLKARCHLVLLR